MSALARAHVFCTTALLTPSPTPWRSLKAPEIVEQLVEFVTSEVAPDTPDERKYKYPFLAYEIFQCELTEIIDAVFETDGLFGRFMSFVDKDEELDSLLVGYFCKVLLVLMRKRPALAETHLRENPATLEKLLRHTTSACVADFFVNLLGAGMQVESPLLPVEFLVEQRLVPRLVERIAPPPGPDSRASAATILVALLENGYCSEFPDAPTAPLVVQLKETECTDLLVGYCSSDSPPTQLHAMAVLTAFLDMLRDEPAEDDDASPDLVCKIAAKGGDFAAQLREAPGMGACTMSFGEMPQTLGTKRLALINFLLALLRSRAPEVAAMFVDQKILEPIIALFFELRFNNLLHNALVAMVRTAINEVEENADLVRSILVDCGLCARIVEAFQGYDLQDDKVFFSAGYFGHLQMLAEELSTSTAESVVGAIAALPGAAAAPEPEAEPAAHTGLAAEWAALSAEGGALATLRALLESSLGGSRPGLSLDSGSESDEPSLYGAQSSVWADRPSSAGDPPAAAETEPEGKAEEEEEEAEGGGESGGGGGGEADAFAAGEQKEMEDAFAQLSSGGGDDFGTDPLSALALLLCKNCWLCLGET